MEYGDTHLTVMSPIKNLTALNVNRYFKLKTILKNTRPMTMIYNQ